MSKQIIKLLFFGVVLTICVEGSALEAEFVKLSKGLFSEKPPEDDSDILITMLVKHHESDDEYMGVTVRNDKAGATVVSLLRKNVAPVDINAVAADERFFSRWFGSFFVTNVVERVPQDDPFPPGMGGVGYYFRVRVKDDYVYFYRQDFDSIRRLNVAEGEVKDIDLRAEQSLLSIRSYLLGRVAGLTGKK